MDTLQRKLDFARPPVEEVVLGVLFNPLDRLLAPHLGEIWQEFKRDGFVHILEQPPLFHAVETFPVSGQEAQLRIGHVPPLARIWFIHETETEIIQVQRDRFTFNWRKTELAQVYPGFTAICGKFEDFYRRFGKVIKNMQIGEVTPLQYELTYIDQLRHGDGWDTLDDLGEVYNMFVDSPWAGAESVDFRASFPVAELHGRLHVAIGNRVKLPEELQTLQTNFTVLGFPEGMDDAVIAWFKSARNQICEKFTGMFTENIQTLIWERKS